MIKIGDLFIFSNLYDSFLDYKYQEEKYRNIYIFKEYQFINEHYTDIFRETELSVEIFREPSDEIFRELKQ